MAELGLPATARGRGPGARRHGGQPAGRHRARPAARRPGPAGARRPDPVVGHLGRRLRRAGPGPRPRRPGGRRAVRPGGWVGRARRRSVHGDRGRRSRRSCAPSRPGWSTSTATGCRHGIRWWARRSTPSLPPEQRRRLHAAVADALPPGAHRRTGPAPRRRRRRARTRTSPPPSRRSPRAASRRGAPAVAAAGLERAAGITPVAGRRADRLLAAAEAAWAAGDAAWATRLCDEVVRDSPGPAPPWRAEALAGSIAARAGSLERRAALPARGGRRGRRSTTREAASRIVAEVVTLAFTLADAGAAATAARHATVLLGHDLTGAARGRCLMTTGMAAVLGGRSGEAELRAALTLLRMPGAHPPLGDGATRDPRDDEDEVWALEHHALAARRRGRRRAGPRDRGPAGDLGRRAAAPAAVLPRPRRRDARPLGAGPLGLRRVDRAGGGAGAGHRAGDVAGRAGVARGPHRCRRRLRPARRAGAGPRDTALERHRRGVGRLRAR